MRVAALGRTQWLSDSIRAVARAGHEVVLIGTCPAAPESTVDEHDFALLAQELGCEYFCDAAINRWEYRQMARASGAQVGISVNWLTLIGQAFLDTLEHGVVNAHAGDLPRYRGNAVINWAILAGEENVVVSLHRMVAELDAGSILLQRALPLTPHTYVADVYSFLGQVIPLMFVEVLDRLASGGAEAREQPKDPAMSLRCFPRLPQDGELDWTRPAEELSRLVRATSEPFAGAYSFLGTSRLIVWRAHPERLAHPWLGVPGQVAERRPASGEVAILTGAGVLVLEEVETAADGRGQASDLLRSIRLRLGMDVPSEVTRLLERVAELERRVPDGPARANEQAPPGGAQCGGAER